MGNERPKQVIDVLAGWQECISHTIHIGPNSADFVRYNFWSTPQLHHRRHHPVIWNNLVLFFISNFERAPVSVDPILLDSFGKSGLRTIFIRWGNSGKASFHCVNFPV